jgi:ankyrin repeat protein
VAASQNDVDMLKYFLEKGCDIEKISIYGKPINWAIGNQSIEAVKLLLDNGADANGDKTCPAPAPLILAVDF